MPRIQHATPATRYDTVAITLHWLIGLALLAQIAFGLLLDDLAPRGTPERSGVINLHKSFGLVLALAILLRLGWRWRHAVPAWPAVMPQWQQRAAALTHRLLYACMLLMPLSGYMGSNFSKHGIKFFGHRWPAWGPDSPTVYAFFNGLHKITAALFCALIALHVIAALKHAWVNRDGVFGRILPRRTQ